MPNTFYPKKSLLVDASAPHPKNTQYKVSIGEEDWGGKTQTVIKVQLVYNGKVAGRKAPSYPYGSDDADRVAEAMEKIGSVDKETGKELLRRGPSEGPRRAGNEMGRY